MVSLETGRVCIKTVGREAGGYCVVLKKEKGSFALVTGPRLLTGVKRRRVNVTHIEPTQHKLEIGEGASDEEIISAYEKANLVKRFKLKKPSAAQMKEQAKPKEELKKKETKGKEKK